MDIPKVIGQGLQMMDDRAFEDLVFALVRVDHPEARQLTPPDAGRDVIVPASGTSREIAFQVKHHTSGIDWGKCEDSLKQALKMRDPESLTFVFPVNMTEGKEPGLQDLRARYSNVTLPEPWTLASLREKLLAHPDIRRNHIDNVLGLDHEYAVEMLERGSKLAARWVDQTTAALRGPLAVLGEEAALEKAEAALERGDNRDGVHGPGRHRGARCRNDACHRRRAAPARGARGR